MQDANESKVRRRVPLYIAINENLIKELARRLDIFPLNEKCAQARSRKKKDDLIYSLVKVALTLENTRQAR